jgi:hypothetical protein
MRSAEARESLSRGLETSFLHPVPRNSAAPDRQNRNRNCNSDSSLHVIAKHRQRSILGIRIAPCFAVCLAPRAKTRRSVMRTLKLTGTIGLFCTVLISDCSNPSSISPLSPSAVIADSTAQLSAFSSSGLGNGHGNGNGNGGNPSGNGGGNPNGNGNGSSNGGGKPTAPPVVQAPAPAAKKIEIEGFISAIAGSVLTINSQDVVVPVEVVVHHGSHVIDFADLKVGDRLHVRAISVDDVLTATDVKLQNPGDEEEEEGGTGGTPITVDGLVSALAVTACPNLSFTLGTQAVATNSSTVFSGGTCNVIVSGGHVQVLGVVQSGVLVATQVQIF